MKNNAITLFLLLSVMTGFSQDLNYDVHGAYSRSVTKEKLNDAKTMRDINPGYPTSSWITDYVSAEILATNNGKAMKAAGKNEVLSEEQKNILKTADLGTDVVIDVKFKQVNTVTGDVEIRKMHFSFTLVPEVEAEYPGGQEQLTQYLKQNAISKISVKDSKNFPMTKVRFIVNEAGEIADAKISATSGDREIDGLLLETINKMTKWKPAENSKGIKVKQEFEFSVGNGGC